MILEENFGNLNVLDKSFLYFIERDFDTGNYLNKTLNIKGSLITPESKVEVDPVSPHNMKRLVEILDDFTVAFIVFRINRKQLCLITTNKKIYNQDYALSRILVKINTIYDDIVGSADMQYFDNDEQLKRWLKYVYEKYKDKVETTKKPVWDILVVRNDINVSKKWSNRDENKEGIIPTSKDKEAYRNFLLSYQHAWKIKCEKWYAEHRTDAQTPNEIKNLLMKSRVSSFKFKGNLYVIFGGQITYIGIDEKNERFLFYHKEGVRKEGELNGFAIGYKFKGLTPQITGIYYSTAKNPPDIFSKASYEPLV